ncbi:NADH-quinone oxidoreductase subunit L [Haloquadratum walsbyi]|jgi:NADH dehydrogenase subunit L (EC 1.6.5.3)|uniref:Proton-translocating NADH-quinone oxidoreductase, chain L n=1 Tax=Haloquadratum walsbyi J07HQW2 TaxID=1238425 RepID=U1NID1_9EURY|nr:NADH-quinone oxidoreductase subunit L [Haloquadratum walsbyi]ERG96668.1 MAG: proton-translocating NADH-quinone oxidoreductase, chain L [Haloquadratum walsbyi J07HQW2]
MVGIFDFTPAIVLLPFVSFLIALAFGNRLPKGGALAGITATGGSLLIAIVTAVVVARGNVYDATVYTWASGLDVVDLTFGVLIDPLSAMMLIIVSLVSFLVHIFSLGYMNAEGEVGLPRYYAGLGLFSASMLGFVVADNLLMAFMFFELVGLCSYLLIGFWFREPGPPSAAKKAFLVTRFGDYFFLIGVVAVFATFGTAAFSGSESFPVLAEAALQGGAAESIRTFGFEPQLWFTIIGLLILGGVVGKSAQFPLHTWLPDAMEGPTPVSALIHAATMVAAGVYLIARMYGFYALSPTALAIIAFFGGFTALVAATMGVVKREIKQVLAYSTISQYGYIMLGLGGGGYVAATFHLMTHAFFKALLFLGAGSVIIAMHHTEDMWEMGGLKEKLPVTYYTFITGSLALAGIIPFAGFWSKDEVLYETLLHGLDGNIILLAAYAMGLIAVFFTGFYTFRMVFLTFHGNPRSETARDPDAVGMNVKIPLVVLGTLAATTGFLNMTPVAKLTGLHIEFLHKWLEHGFASLTVEHYGELLHDVAGYGAAGIELSPILPGAVSLGLALAGFLLAYQLYNVPEPVAHTDRLGSFKTMLYNNYYQDEYQVWIATRFTQPLARVANKLDQGVVDGVVNGVSGISLFAGSRIKRIQTGVISNYAALLTLGLTALLVGLGLMGGWFA